MVVLLTTRNNFMVASNFRVLMMLSGDVESCVLLGRTFTSIGRLSADGEQVLSVVDGRLTLTYAGGDNCASGRQRKTIITLLCDENSLVIQILPICHCCTGISLAVVRSSCNRQHSEIDDCLEDKREDY